MINSKKLKVAAAAVAGGLLLGGGSAAFASTTASTPASGTIHVFVDVDVKSQIVQPIVITGAIGDYGTAIDTTKSGKRSANGNYEKIDLKKGSFVVNATALNTKANTAQPSFDAATCSFSLTVSAPTTLSKGAGLYKGISGTVTVTEGFGAILPRTASGACNQNANPLSEGGYVVGSGKVKF